MKILVKEIDAMHRFSCGIVRSSSGAFVISVIEISVVFN